MPHSESSAAHWVTLIGAAHLPSRGGQAGAADPGAPAAAVAELTAEVQRRAGELGAATLPVGGAESGELLLAFGRAVEEAAQGQRRVALFAGADRSAGRIAAAALLVATPELAGGVRRRVALAVGSAATLIDALERARDAAGIERAELPAVLSATVEPSARRHEAARLTAWRAAAPIVWLGPRLGVSGGLLELLALLAALEETGPQLVVVGAGDRWVVVALRCAGIR